jgi:hypothetical protein
VAFRPHLDSRHMTGSVVLLDPLNGVRRETTARRNVEHVYTGIAPQGHLPFAAETSGNPEPFFVDLASSGLVAQLASRSWYSGDFNRIFLVESPMRMS